MENKATNNQSIGEKIRTLRAKRRYSQTELANQLGVSNQAVSKWEKEISKPSVEHLFKISKMFNVPTDYFSSIQSVDNSTPDVKPVGMETIRELYKIGRGPSSSHTIGPERACIRFKTKNSEADRFETILYGSLSKTGKGHGTDTVIKKTFSPVECEVVFNYTEECTVHPNTFDLIAYKNGSVIDKTRVYSVGGGTIRLENEAVSQRKYCYKLSKFSDIADYCREKGIRLYDYVFENEDQEFYSYLEEIWVAMKTSIKKGLNDEGVLAGGLNVEKKAKSLFNNQHIDESPEIRETRIVCSYAFAVSEQNAAGEHIVTAPTCGAAGVLPAVLYYQQQKNGFSDREIIQALATAGLMGNLIKHNASISGAECGCQAEVGSACAMASAALAELFKLSIDKIEYAAEIAIEHHLGLTCDPICGLVQIPCIERNAVAAMRAINAVNLSSFLWNSRKISFDKVVNTMKETGRDMRVSYKETSEAGLAKITIK